MSQTVCVRLDAADMAKLAAVAGAGCAVARAVGISLRAVQQIWAAHRLQPHRLRTFKRSHAPAFAAEVEDVVGLYMAPPHSEWFYPSTRKARSRP